MSPILGIIASSQQPALNATSFDSIATVTVGAGGSSTITFSSIPSTYKHLQIRGIANNTSGTSIQVEFNDDTGNNYTVHSLYGTGASAGSNASTSRANNLMFYSMGMPDGANIFGGAVADILDYTSTNKVKTIRHISGYDSNGAGGIGLGSGLWQKNSSGVYEAITKIKLSPQTGNFSQYSTFALYGVKG